MDKMNTSEVEAIIQPDEASAPFFDGAANGRYMLLRCKACGEWHAPQAVMCMECASPDLEWQEASGKGKLHSFVIVHRAQIPGIEAPYNLSVVETDEGPRVVSRIVGIDNNQIEVGMALNVTFGKLTNGMSLPYFTPA